MLYIAKHMCGEFYFQSDVTRDRVGQRMEKFFHEHAFCDGKLNDQPFSEKVDPNYKTEYDGCGDFGIIYESSNAFIPLLVKRGM